MNCIQKREVNLGSLSEMIEVGKPWREDSFNDEVSSFDYCDALGDWDEVGEPSEAIQPN